MRKINLEKCKKYNTENKGITLIALAISRKCVRPN